jgi:NAD+ diphosphatase
MNDSSANLRTMGTPADFEPGAALPKAFAAASVFFVWRDDKILVRDSDPPTLPTFADVTRLGIDGAHHYLGRYQGIDCIALRVASDVPDLAGWQWRGLRSLFLQIPDPLLALAGRSSQVVEWDRSHRYCGRCGTATVNKPDERAKQCPACGYVVYPRVSPAMMVLVTRGRELLLARANRFPNAMYSALAGFVELGESIEDCIHREVREEVGVEVDQLRYFASQSWPFPHSLMIAFNAEYVSGEARPCDDEIADVQWFTPDALPPLPGPVSISRKLIDATIARLRSLS